MTPAVSPYFHNTAVTASDQSRTRRNWGVRLYIEQFPVSSDFIISRCPTFFVFTKIVLDYKAKIVYQLDKKVNILTHNQLCLMLHFLNHKLIMLHTFPQHAKVFASASPVLDWLCYRVYIWVPSRYRANHHLFSHSNSWPVVGLVAFSDDLNSFPTHFLFIFRYTYKPILY